MCGSSENAICRQMRRGGSLRLPCHRVITRVVLQSRSIGLAVVGAELVGSGCSLRLFFSCHRPVRDCTGACSILDTHRHSVFQGRRTEVDADLFEIFSSCVIPFQDNVGPRQHGFLDRPEIFHSQS